MYPDGRRTTVHPGPLGAELEGGSRPTHFAGMLTVVLKLLQIVRPDRAFFGEKDYQQLVLVRQMVDDLNIDVRIVGVPTVREADGLAMSSRNRYLSPEEREQASALSSALLAGKYAASVVGPRPSSMPPAPCSTRFPPSAPTTWNCVTVAGTRPGGRPRPVADRCPPG